MSSLKSRGNPAMKKIEYIVVFLIIAGITWIAVDPEDPNEEAEFNELAKRITWIAGPIAWVRNDRGNDSLPKIGQYIEENELRSRIDESFRDFKWSAEDPWSDYLDGAEFGYSTKLIKRESRDQIILVWVKHVKYPSIKYVTWSGKIGTTGRREMKKLIKEGKAPDKKS